MNTCGKCGKEVRVIQHLNDGGWYLCEDERIKFNECTQYENLITQEGNEILVYPFIKYPDETFGYRRHTCRDRI